MLQITSSVSLLASTVALGRPLLATISYDSNGNFASHRKNSPFPGWPSFGL